MALTAQITRTINDSNQRLFYAIALSIFLHTLVVFYLNLDKQDSHEPEERLMEVTLQAPPEKEKVKQPVDLPKPLPKQMVTPPEVTEAEKPPENTNFLSDKNTIVPKEQIKHGDGGKPVKAEPKKEKENPQKESPQNEKKQKESPQKESSQKESQSKNTKKENIKESLELNRDSLTENRPTDKKVNLMLDPESLSALARNPQESKGTLRNLTRYQPFSRDSASSSELFRFRPGSQDFLPSIPDGEVTLLNAKADKFAPFVRRVASQVFGVVRKLQWHNIPASEVIRIADYTTIEAVLSPQGKLIKVNFQDSSGSPSFDKVITQSVREGASDQNPPKGVAAEDGNIHFVFKSRCWSRPGAAGVPDNRWLLLATGLL